jgi:hypothetical protein
LIVAAIQVNAPSDPIDRQQLLAMTMLTIETNIPAVTFGGGLNWSTQHFNL